MAADLITQELIADLATTTSGPGTPDALSQVLIADFAAVVPVLLLPAVAPTLPQSATTPPQAVYPASFPLTEEPDAITTRLQTVDGL